VVSLSLPVGSCSTPESKIRSPSAGSLYAGGRPHTTAAGRLFTVGPDVAKLLAVKTLGEGVLGFVWLYLHGNVAEAGEFEYILGFFHPWQCNKEQGNWFGTTLVPFLVLRNSKFCWATPFICFCSWMRLAAKVNIIGGGRPSSPGAGAAASSELDFETGVSVSMWAVQRGAQEVTCSHPHGWCCYGGFLGSAGCLSRGVSFSASDFIEAIHLLCLSYLATSFKDIFQLMKCHCICPIQCAEQCLTVQSVAVTLAVVFR
jgi:hypothetical protein